MEQVQQQPIKGAKWIIVLGILSFVGCVFYAIPGTVISVIGMTRFRKVRRIAETDRATYENAYVDARVGLILCVLGLIASIATLIWTISLFKDTWFR